MSEIKQVNALGTIASIRKATQDSLKPIIEQIQRKMVAINKETIQLASKTQKISQIQKRQHRSEQSIRYLQSQLLDLKEYSQSISLQQAADKELWERNEKKTRQEFRKVGKDKEKQDIIIQTMKDRNERINKELNTALESMKGREHVLEERFKALTERSELLSFEVKASAEKMSQEFDEIKHSLSHQLKANMRRLQLLDMYEAQKELMANKMKEMSDALEEKVRQQDYDFYKECVSKEQERVLDLVKKMIEDNFTDKTRQLLLLLPQMREQLLYCLNYEKKLHQLSLKDSQLLALINNNRLESEMAHNKFKTNVYDKFLTLEEERIEMGKGLSKALSFQSQMIQKLDEYSHKLKQQLRQQNYRKSRQLFNEIKVSFADKKEEIRQRQLQKIIQQRQKLFDRSQEMENLANKISEILTNFSTRITKIKSDNEMFVEKVKKELLNIQTLRKVINNNSSLIGETLSQMMETMLISACIEIEKDSKNDEEIAYSTHHDGVIFQKYNHNKQGQSGNILYRRKLMNSKLLKRALIASITHVYDKLMDEQNCLCWNDHSPSNYFKDSIEPIYQNLSLKINLDSSERMFNKTNKVKNNDSFTIHPARETIMTTFENNESTHRKYTATHRSRKTRYDGDSIFLAKSARRVRGSLNSTIALQ